MKPPEVDSQTITPFEAIRPQILINKRPVAEVGLSAPPGLAEVVAYSRQNFVFYHSPNMCVVLVGESFLRSEAAWAELSMIGGVSHYLAHHLARSSRGLAEFHLIRTGLG